MSVKFSRIILRNGKQSELLSDILAVGEPAFLTDRGHLVIKKADGTLAVFKELEDGEVGLGKLSDDVIQRLETIESDIRAVDEKEFFDGVYITENSELQFTCGGVDVGDPIAIVTGGGGGGSGSGGSVSVLKLTYNDSANVYTPLNRKCTVKYNVTSTIDGEITGNCTAVYSVNDIKVSSVDIEQGLNSFDCEKYLKVGTNKVMVKVTDSYGSTRSLRWTVNAIALSISSTFDSTVPINNSNIIIKYLLTGDGDKTVYFSVDGEVVSTAHVQISNRQYTETIPQLPHGEHIIEVYAETSVNDMRVTSNTLRYSVICLTPNTTVPIIACPFNVTEATQGDLLSFEYRVYDPMKHNATIRLAINGTTVNTLSVDRSVHTWNVSDYPSGNVTFSIIYGVYRKNFTVQVSGFVKPVQASDTGLMLHLDSAGRSNAELNPGNWTDRGITTEFNDFNFISNGWVIDEKGDTTLRCNGKAQAVINHLPFESDCRTNGKVIELEFKVKDVLDYDVPVISCQSDNGVGFVVYPNKFVFNSAQSQVFANFKEEEKIRISLVVQDRSQDRLISTYINGVCCGCSQYPDNDDFSQPSAVPITIGAGSSLCALDFYILRVYDNDLNQYDILNNYIADRNRTDELMALYEKNNIFDSYGNVLYDNVLSMIPCMTVIGELPTFKGDKKMVSIIYENEQDQARSFTADNVQIDVQGTSSATLFRKNFKWKLKSGCTMTVSGDELDKYQLTADSIAESTFCMKANYMESSNSHNTELARLIPTLMPLMPQQELDSRVRSTILGFPCIMWHRATPDSERTFIGIYDFNNDKSNVETFGCSDEYPNAQIVEFCNNTSLACQFLSTDYDAADFEFRHPDGYTDFTEFEKLLAWVVSIDLTTGEGQTLTNKIERFKAEAPLHIDVDACIAYWLYTDVFAMVDSRAKNFFPGTSNFENDVWRPYPYDMDTCFGLNNEGVISFDYFIEVHDKLGNANCYNGEMSRLWNNIEVAYPDRIKALYQNWRSTGKLSYDTVINQFYENTISKLSAALYNLDGEYKYLGPVKANNDTSKLFCWQGDRFERLKWWWFNRVRYKDGQYETGDYMANYIQMRLYTPIDNNLAVPTNFDFNISSYLAGYVKVKYGSKMRGTRKAANTSVHIVAPDDTFNDTECVLYGYGITEIGDLAPKYVGTVDVSMATSLKSLKIGDTRNGYSNTNLRGLSLGANTLLTTINIANCPNLTETIDVTGCINLEEIIATGSSITGVKFPEGGNLKRVFLPSTVSNLTIVGHKDITELVIEGYDNISTLRLENFPLDITQLIKSCNSLYRVRLINVNITDTDFSILEKLRSGSLIGLDEQDNNIDRPVVTGRFYLEGTIKMSDKVMYEDEFQGLTVSADEIIDDVLYDEEGKPLADSDNNVLVLPADTAFTLNYSAAEVDQFIDDVQQAYQELQEREKI